MTSDDKTLLSPPALGLLLDVSDTERPRRGTFPRGVKRWLLRVNWLFVFCVLLPTLIAVVYYGFIASDVYISESSFVVQSVQEQNQSSSGLGALLKGSMSSSGDSDSANVQEFMQSRDALRNLEKELDVRKALENSNIDPIARFGGAFGWDRSFEALYKYYKKNVVLLESAEASTSIAELQVRAFTAEDAYRINKRLLEMGEKLVNTLNERLQSDLVRFAQAEVDAAKKTAETATLALAAYRNSKTLVNPDTEEKMQLELVLKLTEDVIDARNQIAQLSNSSPNNPQIATLRDRIGSLETEIAKQQAKATGSSASLTNMASEYERLSFERDFSQKQLAESLTFLERSRNDAQRKQLYLERIVEPNTPDVAVEPKRIRNTLYFIVLGLVAWGIVTLFVAGVREHQQ